LNGEELEAQKQEKELRLAHALKTEKWLAKSPKGRGEMQHKNLWLRDLTTGAEGQLTNLPSEFDIRDYDTSQIAERLSWNARKHARMLSCSSCLIDSPDTRVSIRLDRTEYAASYGDYLGQSKMNVSAVTNA